MAEHIEPDRPGQIRDARGRVLDEPTYVSFASTGYCCDGCDEGHDGNPESLQPVELTVAWRDDLDAAAGMAIEVRWTTAGGKPQSLVMDTWAADALASALHRAHFGVGRGSE